MKYLLPIIAGLFIASTVYAQDFKPREPKQSQKQADFVIIPSQGRSGPDAPDVRWPKPVDVVNVCGDYLLSVEVGAPGGLMSVDFLVDSFAAGQQIPATLVNGRWEANWVMPCDEINHHNYEIKAHAVGANDTYTVAILWVYLR